MNKKRETAWNLSKRTRKDLQIDSVITGKPWYLTTGWSKVVLACCIIIDLLGFYTITIALSKPIEDSENLALSILPIAGLAAAFEVAPLYMGYAMCLEFHDFGERIRKPVLGFSMAAFLLGVAVNYCFRFLTFAGQFLPDIVDYAKQFDISEIARSMSAGEFLEKAVWKLIRIYADLAKEKELTVTLGGTIIFSLVPVITSLINLTIGCLAFDPLYADVVRLSKKLAELRARKCWWEAKRAEMKQESGKYLEGCKELRQATEGKRFEMQKEYVHIVVDGMVKKEAEYQKKQEEKKNKKNRKKQGGGDSTESRREFA